MSPNARLEPQDLYLFNEGTHDRLYAKLGAHLARTSEGDVSGGATFSVWAPNADRVAVIGEWNGWDPDADVLEPLATSGVWWGHVSGAAKGAAYKYRIRTRHDRRDLDKSDPFAFHTETPPRTASVVWDLDYAWNDDEWLAARAARNALSAPIAIYEVHLGSWRRVPEEGGRSLGYREIAPLLVEHVRAHGFTHVELMPVMEHPFFGSWGYQSTGYFAPTARYGTPQDFMFLIDTLHQAGIGVILDWVPSHFPDDPHGLGSFDGTHLYEHADPRQGFHPDWKSLVFNYGRHEVRSFLLSSAMFWLDRYHADGLRVDAVASMLYLDYSRAPGEWIPNRFGGRENLDAIELLRNLNTHVYAAFPGVQTYAEESTAWPQVSRPSYVGGLGFGLKWDMGWMHDTLDYLSRDPIHRKHHHDRLTFRSVYQFAENFVLPLSHDEVVHGKGSLVEKMPGDRWRKLANLRLLYGYMYAVPGKKLLFMGSELAQWREWDHDGSLDWHLLGEAAHAGVARWVRDLNTTYRAERCLHQKDVDPTGFAWVDGNDVEGSTLTFLRRGNDPDEAILAALNFTPVPRTNFRIGVPFAGRWEEILNGDAPLYGGSGQGNLGGVSTDPVAMHGSYQSLTVTLPPLALVLFRGRAPGSGIRPAQ